MDGSDARAANATSGAAHPATIGGRSLHGAMMTLCLLVLLVLVNVLAAAAPGSWFANYGKGAMPP